MPHLYADTDRAGAFGFGYAQAEDRLLALIRNYTEASGQLARIDGDASVSSDFQQRLWGHHAMALRELEQTPEDVSHWLEAFAAGVRHYTEQNEDRVPKGTETVQPVHILTLARHLYWRGILQQLDAEHVRSQRDAEHRRTPSSRGTLWGLRRNAPWKMRSRL